MANKKITELPELTSVADGDWHYVVDISDLTESTEGTSKKITTANSLNAYVAKAESGSILALTTGVTNFVFLNTIENRIVIGGAMTELKSISSTTNTFLYTGRDLFIQKESAGSLLLKHLQSGFGNYQFAFPNEVDFTLQSKYIAHFKLRFTGTNTGIYDYVGSVASPVITFKSKSTYALMIADGTPTVATIYNIVNDENKGYNRSTYLWKTDGNREWLASTPDN